MLASPYFVAILGECSGGGVQFSGAEAGEDVSRKMWRGKGLQSRGEGNDVDWCVEAIPLLGLIIAHLLTVNELEDLLYQASEKGLFVCLKHISP